MAAWIGSTVKILLFGDFFPLSQLPFLEDALRCSTRCCVSPADAVAPWVFRGPPPGAAPKCWGMGGMAGCPPRSLAAFVWFSLVPARWEPMGGKRVNSFKLTGSESY